MFRRLSSMLGNFEIVNFDEGHVNGTSLQGYINENYFNLVDVFGEPTYSDASGDGKVYTEWTLRFEVQEDGEEDTDIVYATIYDWKEESADVARTATNYRWHIGGNSMDAIDVVTQAIKEHFNG